MYSAVIRAVGTLPLHDAVSGVQSFIGHLDGIASIAGHELVSGLPACSHAKGTLRGAAALRHNSHSDNPDEQSAQDH